MVVGLHSSGRGTEYTLKVKVEGCAPLSVDVEEIESPIRLALKKGDSVITGVVRDAATFL